MLEREIRECHITLYIMSPPTDKQSLEEFHSRLFDYVKLIILEIVQISI